MGVREGSDERHRRLGHPPLLRLALPDGARGFAGSNEPPDDDGGYDLDDDNASSGRGRRRSLIRRRSQNHSGSETSTLKVP